MTLLCWAVAIANRLLISELINAINKYSQCFFLKFWTLIEFLHLVCVMILLYLCTFNRFYNHVLFLADTGTTKKSEMKVAWYSNEETISMQR